MAEKQGQYRVYLKDKENSKQGEIVKGSRLKTNSPKLAEKTFRELLAREDLKGKNFHAVLTLDKKTLMYHRFDKEPGDTDFVSLEDTIKLHHD